MLITSRWLCAGNVVVCGNAVIVILWIDHCRNFRVRKSSTLAEFMEMLSSSLVRITCCVYFAFYFVFSVQCIIIVMQGIQYIQYGLWTMNMWHFTLFANSQQILADLNIVWFALFYHGWISCSFVEEKFHVILNAYDTHTT